MKIHTFIRHCNFSANSVGKNRPIGFSREKCWENLKSTINKNIDTTITVIFDDTPNKDHFLYNTQKNKEYNIVCKNGGTDAHSFLNLINYVVEQSIGDDDIVYITEDDYLHKEDWNKIMLDAFQNMEVDYLTLYDHADKYFLPMYNNLTSAIIPTKLCHWRTTPSTTNTYACKFKTLKNHIEIHRQFCDLEKGFTRDHDKFTYLWQHGSNLISSIPGYSTHCEIEYMSPITNWEKYLN